MPNWPRIALYIIMGWLVVPLLPHLRGLLPAEALGWLVAGGIVYMVGVLIFAFDRPTLWPGRNIAHGLWHLFVLGGSACHYVLVLRYIALPAA
jgi:hemolysin III